MTSEHLHLLPSQAGDTPDSLCGSRNNLSLPDDYSMVLLGCQLISYQPGNQRLVDPMDRRIDSIRIYPYADGRGAELLDIPLLSVAFLCQHIIGRASCGYSS